MTCRQVIDISALTATAGLWINLEEQSAIPTGSQQDLKRGGSAVGALLDQINAGDHRHADPAEGGV